jgi:tetratricopeptide (TPR) repeat protein
MSTAGKRARSGEGRCLRTPRRPLGLRVATPLTDAHFARARSCRGCAREYEEALDLDANFVLARALLGLAYISKGMPDRAVAEVQTARALGARPDVIAFHGYILARAARKREVLKDLDDLHRLASPRDPSPFLVALVYTGLEDNDRAFEWLAKAVDARAWEMPTLKASPVFDRLRSDPRFPALLDRVGLPR